MRSFVRRRSAAPVFCLLTALAAGCGGGSPQPAATAPPRSAQAPPAADAVAIPAPALQTELPEAVRSVIAAPFTGDLDQMVQRRLIRVGVTFNRTYYFVDDGQPRGITYEYLKAFEDDLNKKLGTGNLKVNVVFVPAPRDLLLSGLTSGKLDVVVAQLTDTPERRKLVDFTNPTRTGVNEVVVTGPLSPKVAAVDDLSGKSVFVRRTSSYYPSLLRLNEELKARGKAPVSIREASESLEDDDLLEMVNAGLIPVVVVDDYIAEFWKQVFPAIRVHPTVTVREGGSLAPAIRKNSPKLAAALNDFVARFGLGTAFGNVVQKKYLVNTTYVKNATSTAQRKKFDATVRLFRKYGDRYDVDYLLMAAQGYQESTLDQRKKSRAGAVGVMQLMPKTGREQKVGDITRLEPNIHAGVKYMRFMMDQYYKDEPMTPLDKGLFTFASYNAGPGRIKQLREEAARRGLNPNVWFGSVEQVASERIGRETVTYVSNIYKYYIAYRLVMEEAARKTAAKVALQRRK